MKALTVLQPWASLLACGAKKIETRGWQTSYRGLLAIHAGKSERHMALTDREPFHTALRHEFCPTGCILAVGELWKIERITSGNQPGEPERSFGDYTPGRYAWHIRNVKRLRTPVPMKGKQALWEWHVRPARLKFE